MKNEHPSPAATKPRDFRLATPANWFKLDLTRGASRDSIKALVKQHLGTDPEGEAARQELTAVLERATSDAIDQGAMQAFILSDVIAGRPVSASLTCTLTGSVQTPDLQEVARQLRRSAERSALAVDAQVVELEAGIAVRLRTRRVGQMPPPVARRVEVENLQYFLPIPREDAILLLTFSTPNLPIADALVELFDAVAESLRWEY